MGKVFSLSKGYSFIFTDGHDHLEFWYSAITGREKIFVNGDINYYDINLFSDSSGVITLRNNQYYAELSALGGKERLKGPLICTLFKNSKPYKRQRMVLPEKIKSPYAKLTRFTGIGLGGVLGLIYASIEDYFGLHIRLGNMTLNTGLVIAIVVALIYAQKMGGYTEYYIEEMDVEMDNVTGKNINDDLTAKS